MCADRNVVGQTVLDTVEIQPQPPLVILVGGRANVGENTLIDVLSGPGEPYLTLPHRLHESWTREMQPGREFNHNEREWQFTKLPHIPDEPCSDGLVIARIAHYLKQKRLCTAGLIYLHDFTDQNFDSEQLDAQLEVLGLALGKGSDCYKFIVLNKTDSDTWRGTTEDVERAWQDGLRMQLAKRSAPWWVNVFKIESRQNIQNRDTTLNLFIGGKMEVLLCTEIIKKGKLADTTVGKWYIDGLKRRLRKLKRQRLRQGLHKLQLGERTEMEITLKGELYRWNNCNFPDPCGKECCPNCCFDNRIWCLHSSDCICKEPCLAHG